LSIDAGLRLATDATPLQAAGVAGIIAGLETLAGPEALAALVDIVGPSLIFSLDLKNGQPLASPRWPHRESWQIAALARELGVGRLLILDLARVGVAAGTGTEDFCRRLKETAPHLEVLTGGGISGRDDLQRLRASKVDGVLVASALHDGRLGRDDLD
jgi:phosphoribosylformimino-5-aminoimidazole carboxamide ribotide isomerase